ncbi:MAG: 50S ribosomal protein L18 [Candidatus Lokiarchaeota archaeon]
MAHGPRYRIPFRRRKEGKTNYHKRLKLLKSRKLRAVIRASTNNITVQIVQSRLGGDKVMISAFSKELNKKFDWKANTGNIPAAYLTGYLAGIRSKNKDIEEAILDLGIFYHRNRTMAAFKGLLDAGIQIPHRNEFFPEGLEERLDGSHIENYAKILKKEDPEKYERIFSAYLDKKINPAKISDDFSKILKKLESNA